MTMYLSIEKSPEENFALLANHNATVTVNYAHAVQALKGECFTGKISACIVTSIAFAALGAFVGATISILPAILIGAAFVVMPLASVGIMINSKNNFDSTVAQNAEEVSFIYSKIFGYLNAIQRKKEDNLILLFPDVDFLINRIESKERAERFINIDAMNYDNPIFKYENEDLNACANEYRKLIPLAHSVCDRHPPSTVSSKLWKSLKKCCHSFLHGRGGNENSTYVNLVFSEKTWRAVRY